MPEFLDDPSVLTKERLKSELLAHNVELPAGNPPKDVLVRLYLQKLTVHNQPRDPPATLDTFSSDDDLPPPVVTNRSRSSSRKATRKTDQLPPDVSALTDDGLREQLLHLGADVGPVVASTRKLYEKKLQQLLDQGPARVQKLLDQGPARVPLLVLTDLQSNHNGKPDPYSDEEEGESRRRAQTPAVPPGTGFTWNRLDPPGGAPEPEPDVEPEPVVGRTARSRGETPVTTRSAQRHTVEKIAASEQSPQVEEEEEEEEVLKELFLNDIISPTGITATCRRPIRGAAGRPVTPGDLWNHDKRLFSPRSSKLSGLAERRAAASPPTSFSASSRLLAAAAPPTAVSKAARRSWLWKKLLLLAVVAGFLFLVYQAMEADSQRPFQGARSLEEGSSA